MAIDVLLGGVSIKEILVMITKAKAIVHGSKAIEYALRESKHGTLVLSNLVQNENQGAIYKEFLQAQE